MLWQAVKPHLFTCSFIFFTYLFSSYWFLCKTWRGNNPSYVNSLSYPLYFRYLGGGFFYLFPFPPTPVFYPQSAQSACVCALLEFGLKEAWAGGQQHFCKCLLTPEHALCSLGRTKIKWQSTGLCLVSSHAVPCEAVRTEPNTSVPKCLLGNMAVMLFNCFRCWLMAADSSFPSWIQAPLSSCLLLYSQHIYHMCPTLQVFSILHNPFTWPALYSEHFPSSGKY